MLSCCTFLLISTLAVLTRADIYPACDGIDEGVFLPSPSDCNKFIYCSGEDSQEGSCPEGLDFDAEEGTCAAPEEANCRIGVIEEEITEEPTEIPTTVTTQATTTTEAATLEPTTNQPDDGVVTSGITTAGSGPLVTVVGAQTLVSDNCPAVDKPDQVVLISSNQSCATYYLCHMGQGIELRCTNHLHFNAKTGMCDFPENVGCTLDGPKREQCRPNMAEFFPHATNCNYFYYCIKGFLTLQQCPFFYGWDIERRACVLMSQAKCFQNARNSF